MKRLLPVLFACILIGCTQDNTLSEEQIREEVMTAWAGLYKEYENSDIGFIDYYVDDVIRMDTDGSYKVGKHVFKEGWKEYYQNNEVKVLDYSEPTILPAEGQAVTFNTYKEIFINKETLDSTLVEGTWIAIWKKQDDKSWKVRMSTWHN